MLATTLGLVFLLTFSMSQTLRDVFFGNALQSVSVALVATIAFGLTVLVFGCIAFWRRSGLLRLLRRPRDVLLLNIATGVPWINYLIALSYLEPALVNTVFAGIGPLAVLVVQSGNRLSMAEWAAQAGIGLALFWLVLVSVTGIGGVVSHGWEADAALAGVLIGSVFMAWGHMLARRLNDDGIAPEAVFSVRFVGAIGVGLVLMLMADGQNAGGGERALAFWQIALAAMAFIVLPNFCLQMGVARTSALTVNTIRALGPVFVFAVQFADARIVFAPATLAGIAAFAVFALAASVLRTRAEVVVRPVAV